MKENKTKLPDRNEPASVPDTATSSNGSPAKLNSISIPQVSLPNGGGAIRGIAEKFAVNAVNGTATFSIPVPVSEARGFSPALELSYNSGDGNGVFGLGWSLSLPSIRRKTEKELPTYIDGTDSDTFLFSEAEDLVPAFQKNDSGEFIKDGDGNFITHEYDSADGNFVIRRYLPRIEGAFARIERWTEKFTRLIHWRVISKDNITAIYGKSAGSRIADPVNAGKIFKWLIDFSYDDKGKCISYQYKQEDASGIDVARLHNRNRTNGNAPFTNTYLKRVLYGNVSPYINHGDPVPAQWMFEIILDYGEHETALPFAETGNWSFRQDAFSDYRAGFEIRTCRLCRKFILIHRFNELPGGSAVIKTLELKYGDNGEQSFSFLEEMLVTGFTKHDDGTYTQKSLPSVSFTYQKHEWNQELRFVSPENNLHAPGGLDGQSYQFVDLYSEGLAGILTEQGTGWFYKHNEGGAKFTPAKVVPKPSFSGLQGNLQLVELDADGSKQITQWNTEPRGFFEINDEKNWEPFKAFQHIPNINFRDPNLRMIDLNADGRADLLISEDEFFTWYPSEGKKGFESSGCVFNPVDEEKGPSVTFSNNASSIFLADMDGDGLTDIVRIRNGEVCYWPNMGHGKFGARVTMDLSPVFDQPEKFNPAFILLADIDGSGTNDIIYTGKNQVAIWLNQHGNQFLPTPKIIDTFPGITNYTRVSVTDLLGNGLPCLVWSCDLPQHQPLPLRYVDLLNSKKPHILTGYKNNLGKETELEYKPSTHYYIEDKKKGEPWATKLHFPVQCVSKIVVYDRIMKTRFASEYSYHHGYYDHPEREFRGFGRVDQVDAEQITHFTKQTGEDTVDEDNLNQPPVLTKIWFHTGAFTSSGKIMEQFSNEYFQNTSFQENHFPDTELPAALTIDEYQQALRACKGMLLRKEIYALDATPLQDKPYLVEQHNAQVKFLQPKASHKFAVFLLHESEAITYQYERNPADPRIMHNFVLEIDSYGNELKKVSVVYPKKAAAPADPPNEPEQEQLQVILTENQYTNDIQLALDYRAPALHAGRSYELTGIPAPSSLAGYFSKEEINAAVTGAGFIDYEIKATTGLQKRLIEFMRQQYRGDNGTTILPFGTLESKGLSHQSYKAAFNQNILVNVFSSKTGLLALHGLLTDPLKGAYQFADNYYWIPSGTQNYDPLHFFHSIQFINAFGKITTVEYDANYFLFVQKVADPLGNEVAVSKFNYRTLSAFLMKDMNDNLSAVRFDALGMVVQSFIIGKKGIDAGDEFEDSKTEMKGVVEFPSKRMEYSLFEWYNQSTAPGFDVTNYKPRPNFVRTIFRETHYHANPLHQTKWQEIYSYSDGGGHEVVKKKQAEPGAALKVNEDGTVTVIPDTSPDLRWVGNGRVILNNKGNPVKQYEPYFSVSPAFDDEKEMVELGVTPVLQYDPTGRNIRTDLPNGTFSKVVFDAWKHTSFDQNDTVGESRWYDERILHPIPGVATPQEIRAAQKAFLHNNTPPIVHLDSLGRAFLSVEDNSIEKISSRTKYDIEGNILEEVDGLGRTVMEYEYGMTGNRLKQTGMDSGSRWTINDASGKPLLAWDDRSHALDFEYDDLGRPISSSMKQGGDPAIIFSRIAYGESLANPVAKANNLLGKMHRQYDQSGVVTNHTYDFKGNLLSTSRQFAVSYKNNLDWTSIGAITLGTELFESSTEFDALNRPVKMIAPHSTLPLNEYFPVYNESGSLNQIDVRIRGGDPVTFVSNIDYNAKGQREAIFFGNNSKTSYSYEKETFRLKRILTTRPAAPAILQDLNYTYDPVGNVSEIRDDSRDAVFFDGENVQAVNAYEYDPLYRLIKATGRKHAGQNDIDHNRPDFNYRNHPFIHSGTIDPNDAQAFRNYTEEYSYDKAGNMEEQKHISKNSSWTRSFEFTNGNNQLSGTGVGAFHVNYTYDAHGNIDAMEHLLNLVWDFQDRLKEADLGGGGKSWYVYDAGGQRVRKIIERLDGTRLERLYLGGIELYREFNAGGDTTLERETLHITDGPNRVAMVDTPLIKPAGNQETQLFRYNYDNHLGSASLELDDSAQVISYEEYFPYGATSFYTIDATREIPLKRYRYTGKERDEESGLNYHGARYYAPWLCRWTSTDPAGTADGLNMYRYVSDNPVILHDPSGSQEKPPPYVVTNDDKGNPVYQSTGDQVGKDTGKIAKEVWEEGKDSKEVENLKKIVLDPQLSYLKSTFTKEWEKDKVPMIIGGSVFLVPTLFALTYLTVEDKKLDVPIVGEVHTREIGFGALSAGLGLFSSEVLKDKAKFDVSYENKEGKEKFGYKQSTPFFTESLKLNYDLGIGKDYYKLGVGLSFTPRPDIKVGVSGSATTDAGKDAYGGKFTLKFPIASTPFEFGATGTYKPDPEAGKPSFTGSAEASYAPKVYGTTLQFGFTGFVGAEAPKEGPFMVKSNLDIVKTGPLPMYSPLGSGFVFTLTIPTGKKREK